MNILETGILPWAQPHFGCCHWSFQQGSAPAHKACFVQIGAFRTFWNFIAFNKRPPSNTNLSPINNLAWRVPEAKVNEKTQKNID